MQIYLNQANSHYIPIKQNKMKQEHSTGIDHGKLIHQHNKIKDTQTAEYNIYRNSYCYPYMKIK